MPRRVQDIVPGDRRGIREAPSEPPKTARKLPDKEPEVEIPIHRRAEPMIRRMPVTPPREPMERRPSPPKNRLKWLLIALGIIVVVSLIGFIASSFYSRATFTIVPKTIPLSVNGTYVAQAVPGGGPLSYEVVTVKGSASSTVPATDGPQTSAKASGQAVLQNGYSGQSVRLIAGTRLSNDAGLVYRLSSSIVIPGYSGSGAASVPGTVSVAIVADQPGQTYDMDKAASGKLHIVAYNGSTKYDSIYATLASDVTGGFVGAKKIVSPAVIASTTADLTASLIASLSQQVKDVIPDGYITYDGDYAASFSQPVVDGSGQNMATVSLQGTLYGIIFKKSELLARFSSNQSVSAFGDSAFTSPGLESVQMTITNLKDFSLEKKTTLIIHAKGDLTLIGTVPVDEIRKKLEGLSLASTQDIFKSYSSVIESGSGELVPPWAKIPTDPKRITITVQGQ